MVVGVSGGRTFAAWKVTAVTGFPVKQVGDKPAASDMRSPKANARMQRATTVQSEGVEALEAREERRETGHHWREMGLMRRRSADEERRQRRGEGRKGEKPKVWEKTREERKSRTEEPGLPRWRRYRQYLSTTVHRGSGWPRVRSKRATCESWEE